MKIYNFVSIPSKCNDMIYVEKYQAVLPLYLPNANLWSSKEKSPLVTSHVGDKTFQMPRAVVKIKGKSMPIGHGFLFDFILKVWKIYQ